MVFTSFVARQKGESCDSVMDMEGVGVSGWGSVRREVCVGFVG